MFHGYLGQQQPVPLRSANKQSVLANLHFLWRKQKQFRQYRNFYLQPGHFLGSQRRKTRIA